MSTNHEPNTSKDDIVYFERYGLPYENTKWGKFYANYKDKNNLQIQKYLLKIYNEFQKVKNIDLRSNSLLLTKHYFVKRWFRNTDVDKDGKPCTPKKLLGVYGFHNADVVYSFLKRRVTREYKEIQLFYKNRKIELDKQHNTHRREHAKERVECPICKAKVTRTNLAQHRKTNKNCLTVGASLSIAKSVEEENHEL